MKFGSASNFSFESESNIKTSVALNFFWFGFILYTFAYAYPAIGFSSIKYLQGIQIGGMVFVIPSAIYLFRWNFESIYLRTIFFFYAIWSVITIFRGFQLDYVFIKDIFFNADISIFLFFVPLILLFTNQTENLKKLFTVIIIFNIYYLFLVIKFNKILFYGIGGFRVPDGVTETLSQFLSLPAGFILLTYIYHSKKKIFFVLLILILTLFISTIRARRGIMFMAFCLLFFSYIMFFFSNRGKILKVLLSIALLFFALCYAYLNYTRDQSGKYVLISGRIDEDTRSGVEVYFYNDMSTSDMIFGRGINGLYYCPGIGEDEGSVTIMRSVIETGFLQIILKGGYISLILYLLIAIPAIFKGLFKSKNLLSKACAVWILLFIIFLYPIRIHMFYLSYLIVWISVGICYSNQLSQKTDEELKILFQE
jgi:hypothetical protein